MNNVLAFDIGGTKVKYGIINSSGKILRKGVFDTIISSEDEFLEPILEVIEKEMKTQELEGIAISMPGFVNANKGIAEVCYAIKCIEGKNITSIISEKTGLKVTIENDGKCAAFAEKFNGNALDCSDFICVIIGTGIGGGIYLNDRIVRGNNFRAGEFGFMVCDGIKSNHADDSIFSGNASTRALINEYKKYKGIQLNDVVEGKKVFEDALSDPKVKEIVDNWYKKIAVGIMNLSCMLNPEKILIGGGVSAREEFIDELEKALNNISWWKDVSTKVEICKHRNDAGLIGAAYNFMIEALNE